MCFLFVFASFFFFGGGGRGGGVKQILDKAYVGSTRWESLAPRSAAHHDRDPRVTEESKGCPFLLRRV